MFKRETGKFFGTNPRSVMHTRAWERTQQHRGMREGEDAQTVTVAQWSAELV
jgi:hypothetical protein